MIFAHLGGVPVEETLGALAPMAVAIGAAMRLSVHRLRRVARRPRPGKAIQTLQKQRQFPQDQTSYE